MILSQHVQHCFKPFWKEYFNLIKTLIQEDNWQLLTMTFKLLYL